MLDGVVLARKTGAGALRRPVLVALGLRPDGRKEIVDFRLASRQRERRRVGTLPHRPVPPRAHRRRSRVDLRRRWPRPHRCPANRLSRHRGPALLGAQDQKRPQQGPQARPGRRQGRPPRHHERPQPAQGAQAPRATSPTLGSRPLPRPSPACETTSTTCSPASATKPWPSVNRSEPKRYRTTLPRDPEADMTHGNLPGQNLHGPHPLRRLHTPKRQGIATPFPLHKNLDVTHLHEAVCHRRGVEPAGTGRSAIAE